MIICPLNYNECPQKIIPQPRTAFVMAPSEEKMPPLLEPILENIQRTLNKHSFEYLEGAKIVDYGDFVCSICRYIQGSAFGISISGVDVPITSLCNIFWEKGLMQGFGKPVVLFVDESLSLPSDFVRTYSIFFNKKNYIERFEKLLGKIKELSSYSRLLAEVALEAGDYEKASKYYQDAYLISGSEEYLEQIGELINKLKEMSPELRGLGKRLLENLIVFEKGVKAKG